MFLFDRFASWSPAGAKERLRRGKPPHHMRVAGPLALDSTDWLTELPRSLVASSVDISNSTRLRALPARVECEELDVSNTWVERLDTGLKVSRRILATHCRRLKVVGPLCVQNLQLTACTQLEHLMEGLSVRILDVSQCARITKLPASIAAQLWSLDVSGCTELSSLPEGMLRLQFLNLRGCRKLTSLPSNIQIESRIEVADSGLTGLPESLRSTVVCWRGLPVPDYVAFNPETITVREILYEKNLEIRRVLLERFGIERFFAEAQAELIDRDTDSGGPRRLLRVQFENGDDVVCVEVQCPSTAKKYVLRVPPQTRTCEEAAAWIAGFSNPRYYRPVVET